MVWAQDVGDDGKTLDNERVLVMEFKVIWKGDLERGGKIPATRRCMPVSGTNWYYRWQQNGKNPVTDDK